MHELSAWIFCKPIVPVTEEDTDPDSRSLAANQFRYPVQNGKKLFQIKAEPNGPKVEHFSIAKICGEFFVYKHDSNSIKGRVTHWGHSFALAFYSVVHNLFIKCIKVLFIKFFSLVGVQFKPIVKETADRMWKAGSPWKALLVIIPQMILGIFGFLSCGLLSVRINRCINFLERWSLGMTDDVLKQYSWNYRVRCYDVMFPCHIPFVALKKNNFILDAFKQKQEKSIGISLTRDVEEGLIRSYLWQFMNKEYPINKSVPKEDINLDVNALGS